MVKFSAKGNYDRTIRWLKSAADGSRIERVVERYASEGVSALSRATPVDTGRTASSWGYDIESSKDKITITFTNSYVNKGVNIAIILQYGHGTRNGGYVQGRDYINPAIQPFFDKLADRAWKEVMRD